MLRVGQGFGDDAIFDGIHSLTVTALEHCCVGVVDQPTFEKHLRRSKGLLFQTSVIQSVLEVSRRLRN